MRILHVITTLDIGGAERLMVDLLPQLRDMGHKVELLLFNGVNTEFRTELEHIGIKIYELTYSRDVNSGHLKVYYPWNVFKVRKFLDRYDIIHTHNTACQLYVPIAKTLSGKKTTLVTTEHSSNNRRRDIRWFKPIDKWMYNRYDAVVCISDKARNSLEDYIGKGKNVLTINNGVFCDRLRMLQDKTVLSLPWSPD